MKSTPAWPPHGLVGRQPANARVRSYRQSDAARRAVSREIAAATLSVFREAVEGGEPLARHPEDEAGFAAALSQFLRAHGDEHPKVRTARRAQAS